LTSNSEKNLPTPFLRRCVFHHIKFPERGNRLRLTEIVSGNLGKAISPLEIQILGAVRLRFEFGNEACGSSKEIFAFQSL
jgi:MoxR-like ATPase